MRYANRRFGPLRIFFMSSRTRQLAVVGCLLLAGLAEGIGLAGLLPVLSIATGEGGDSALYGVIVGALAAVGLPLDMPVLLGVVLGGLLLKAALTLLAMNYVGAAMAEVATRLRLRLIRALLDVRWSYFARQPVGRFANAVSGEAARASDAYLSVALFIASAVQAAIYLGLCFLISWQLSLVSFALGALVVLSLSRMVRRTKKAGRQQTRYKQLLVARLSDVLGGIKPLKAMGRHVQLGALFANDARDLHRALRRQVFSKQATKSLQEPMVAIFLCVGFVAATTIWSVPLTQLLVTGLLLARTVSVIGRSQQAYQNVLAAESAYWAIHDLVSDAERQREVSTGTTPPRFTRAITFERVSFGYREVPVLREVSLEMPAGKVVAITGASGAGKTTLADLLLGLFRPERGTIRIDGVPLEEIDIAAWRAMVGYVPQEVVLFHDSVLTNLTLGETDLTREDAEAALRAAGAWDFVSGLPEGIDTVVGERGTLLSGGQRQRLAVARALIRRPRLLILDEATSALDPETEAEICANLKALSRQSGLTILAISHQLAWVEAADKVYHLDRGVIRERAPVPLRASVPA